MKIELIKLKFNDTHSYKYKPFTHCCDEIQNDKAIVFTGEDLVYNAIGIPKENIKYETEFVNRTKETYLNIKGEHKVEGIGFENEIDVHLLIDTDVYDKYEVDFHDGLVFVFLHEIINEKPVLEDVSSEKGE